MKIVSAVSNLLGNTPLEQAMQRHMDELGPPPFDAADSKICRGDPGDADGRRISPRPSTRSACDPDGPPLCRLHRALRTPRGQAEMGSTDVGDVSWAVPTVQVHAPSRDRHPGPHLADHGAGQEPARPQGHGACRQGDGGARRRRLHHGLVGMRALALHPPAGATGCRCANCWGTDLNSRRHRLTSPTSVEPICQVSLGIQRTMNRPRPVRSDPRPIEQ